jgi:hypothetical protein
MSRRASVTAAPPMLRHAAHDKKTEASNHTANHRITVLLFISFFLWHGREAADLSVDAAQCRTQTACCTGPATRCIYELRTKTFA